jgi:hypothetical protein
MKNYLSIQIEQKATNTAGSAVSFYCRVFKNTAYSLLKKMSFMVLLPLVVLLFVFSTVSAQTAENLRDYSYSLTNTEAQHLDELVDGGISTLFIYDKTFETEGETAPAIADVALGSLPELYNAHPEYANIQLLRIKVRNVDDLNYKLDLDKLQHFKNLKYVYVIVTLDVCPEKVGDITCQKTKISNMFSGYETNATPTVLFEIVKVM